MAVLKTLGQANPADSLLIFDHFQVDTSLPKFKKMMEEAAAKRASYQKASSFNTSTITMASNSAFGSGVQVWTEDSDEEMSPNFTTPSFFRRSAGRAKGKPGLVAKVSRWWRRVFREKPIEVVFQMVLANPEELKVFDERSEKLKDLVRRATAAGQQALLQQLTEERQVRVTENVLFAKGMKKVITEAQLLKFVSLCEKDLALDWVTHYTREIPQAALDAKVKCDEVGVFDNYVILHYDPKDVATRKKDRETAARPRDPILFGLIKGSRKLYFVADWVDEHCDLQFKDLVDKLGTPLEMT
jgi:hypothetical protein